MANADIIDIAVFNNSTRLADDAIRISMRAVQRQLTEHLRPAWSVNARVSFFGKDDPLPPNTYWLGFFDDPGSYNELGFHDRTEDGWPVGWVALEDQHVVSREWQVTASHELIEMLTNPLLYNATYHVHPTQGPLFYAHEAADPCDEDAHTYEIDGVRVANFVYPAWFNVEGGGTRLDHRTLLKAPFTPSAGGFSWVWVPALNDWRMLDVNGNLRDDNSKLSSLSRRHRFLTGGNRRSMRKSRR